MRVINKFLDWISRRKTSSYSTKINGIKVKLIKGCFVARIQTKDKSKIGSIKDYLRKEFAK
jgi:hypothetical protein